MNSDRNIARSILPTKKRETLQPRIITWGNGWLTNIIIKRREILPQLINPTQIFHKLVRKQIVHRVPKDSALRWVFFAYTHFPAPVSGAKSPYLRGPRLPSFRNALTPRNLQNPIKRDTPLSDGYLGHKPLIRSSHMANYQSVAGSVSILGECGPCKNEVTKYTFTGKPSLKFCAWWGGRKKEVLVNLHNILKQSIHLWKVFSYS